MLVYAEHVMLFQINNTIDLPTRMVVFLPLNKTKYGTSKRHDAFPVLIVSIALGSIYKKPSFRRVNNNI